MKAIKELEKLGFEYLYQSTRACKQTPRLSGVYCFVDWEIISNQSKVVYVGKSKDLSIRLKPWHKVERLMVDRVGYFPYCYVLFTTEQDTLEVELIKKYTPIFNVAHNPNIQRKITYENGEKIYGH